MFGNILYMLRKSEYSLTQECLALMLTVACRPHRSCHLYQNKTVCLIDNTGILCHWFSGLPQFTSSVRFRPVSLTCFAVLRFAMISPTGWVKKRTVQWHYLRTMCNHLRSVNLAVRRLSLTGEGSMNNVDVHTLSLPRRRHHCRTWNRSVEAEIYIILYLFQFCLKLIWNLTQIQTFIVHLCINVRKNCFLKGFFNDWTRTLLKSRRVV